MRLGYLDGVQPYRLGTHSLAQEDVVLGTRGVVGLGTVLQQLPQSQMPFQACFNYTMGPPQVSFSFRVDPSTNLSMYVGACYGVCFLFGGSPVDAIFTYGAQPLGFVSLQPFGAYLWQAYVHPCDFPVTGILVILYID